MNKRVWLTAVLLSLNLPISAYAYETAGNTSVCFTLEGEDCALPILEELGKAEHTLEVQAYNFTEPRIIQAIIEAHARGVTTTVVLDKISPCQKGEGADPVHDAGIQTYIDFKPKIAHNKVMIIDGKTVVGGSFNYSTNADRANAENVIIIHDPQLATDYAHNFEDRLQVSRDFVPGQCKGKKWKSP